MPTLKETVEENQEARDKLTKQLKELKIVLEESEEDK